jgi:sugar phosphate isomerase/epimerase
MKIACCWMYAIDKYGFPPPVPTMARAIEEMAGLGFKYVELEGVHEDNLGMVIDNKAVLRKALQDAGVKVSNFAIVLPETISMDKKLQERAFDLFARGVEAAVYLGSDFVWVDSHMPPVDILTGVAMTDEVRFGDTWRIRIPEAFDWPRFWDHVVAAVQRLDAICQRAGKPLLIEPRVPEIAANTDGLLRLIDAVGSDSLGVILDTGHLHAQKELLPLSIVKLGQRIRYVHVADNDGRENLHLEPGNGNIDWEGVFVTLKRLGYSSYFAADLQRMPDLDQKFMHTKRFLEGWAERLDM